MTIRHWKSTFTCIVHYFLSFLDDSHQTISQKNKENSIKHDILTRARIFSALEFSALVKTSMSELNKYILRKKQLVCIIVE